MAVVSDLCYEAHAKTPTGPVTRERTDIQALRTGTEAEVSLIMWAASCPVYLLRVGECSL